MRPSQGGAEYFAYDAPGNASCSDVPPDNRFTCAQQALFGACGSAFMRRGNYCAATCGRAPCPPPPPGAAPPLIHAGNLTVTAAVPELCTDVAPPGPGRFSCAQQAAFGKCGAGFMRPGYCASECV